MAVTPVASNGAAYTSLSGPTVSFSYTPQENDVVAVWIGSTSSATIGAGVSGWSDMGPGAINPGDASCALIGVYHVVTAAEEIAGTNSWNLAGVWSGSEAGGWIGAVYRGANPSAPIAGYGHWFTQDTPTTQVLSGISVGTIPANALITSGIIADGPNFTRTTPSGWTQIIQGSGNNSPWLGHRNALTTLNETVASTDIVISTGDEGISITLAIAEFVVVGTDLFPDDSNHSHTSESPSLSQQHLLVADESFISVTSESPDLFQANPYIPADSVHNHAVESPTLSQTHLISPNESVISQTSDSPTLEQTHLLVANDTFHTHRAIGPETPLTVDLFRKAMNRRLVFAHQSVGMQVITGFDNWATTLGEPDPTVVDVVGETVPVSGGFVGHFYAGTNGDGRTKTAHLDSLLRTTDLAEKIDTVVLKFCYADIRNGSAYTPAGLFLDYKTTFDALVLDFPDIEFIYATETIVMEVDEDGPDNALRMEFNELVRAEYGSSGKLWDIARALSTAPNGTRITTGSGPTLVEHMYYEYASADQEHISGVDSIGRKTAAKPLLMILAELDSPTVTLVPVDSSHNHLSESPALAQTHILSASDAAHAVLVDEAVLSQTHILQSSDAAHAVLVDEAILSQTHILQSSDAAHAVLVDQAVLSQTHVLSVSDAAHAILMDEAVLSQTHLLVAEDSVHQTRIDTTIVVQTVVVWPDSTQHAVSIDVPDLIQTHVLLSSDNFIGHLVDSPLFGQNHNLLAASARHNSLSDTAYLIGSLSLLIRAGTKQIVKVLAGNNQVWP